MSSKANVLEKSYVNLTPIGQFMEGIGDLFSLKGADVGNYVSSKMSQFLKYDVSEQMDSLDKDSGVEGFKYLEKYLGEDGNSYDVYLGSNGTIGKLLDENGKPGHKSGEFNYGAAFNGKIYVNQEVLYGSLDSGKVDPFSGHKYRDVLENILAHEYAHIKGKDEKGARDFAAKKTGVRI